MPGQPEESVGYIAGTIRLRSCLPSGTELGTKQLGSQWDHISTTAPVGRNKMASAIRLLFHPRGRDRPYFILLPRFRSSKRTPCSPAIQSADRRRKPPPCFFPASCRWKFDRSHPLVLTIAVVNLLKSKKIHIKFSNHARIIFPILTTSFVRRLDSSLTLSQFYL